MSPNFPSIWLAITVPNKIPIHVAGFHRQWSHKGDRTEATQVEQINIFTNQIESSNKITDKINAKIKIMEIWKSFNIVMYPLKIDTQKINPEVTNTRAMTSNRPIEEKVSTLIDKTCVSDSIKLWLKVPEEIKLCETKLQLKKLARKCSLTLPV